MTIETLARVAFALGLKWECILIPQTMEIGVYALSDEDGESQIRGVETATVQTASTEAEGGCAEEYQHQGSKVQYELPLTA